MSRRDAEAASPASADAAAATATVTAAALLARAAFTPAPNYSVLSENLRKVAPNGIQCSIFCGGRRCKYETPDHWDAAHMAIDGVFSHWVTENILAMARPSTEIIKKKNIVHQFLSAGIRSIINLQIPGEHASCGPTLESSGFSYNPDVFMENNIYFYNFGWKDYGEATTSGLLDMVKVMAFALEEGKVAVHCHAGLGRTGVLIACYLVYSLRVRANDAIRFVRLKRPNAIQTRGQILCVQEFEQFILPLSVVFCNKEFVKDKKQQEFTLAQYLHKQSLMLHGYDARIFKHIPKIVFVLCERILQLCQCPTYSINPDGSNMFPRSFIVASLNINSNCLGLTHNSRSGSAESTSSSNVISVASTRRPSTDLGDFSGSLTDEEQATSSAACVSSDMPSCASGMSGLDDRCLDAMLGDGIEGQVLFDNMCYQELNNQGELEKACEKEQIIPHNVEDAVQALLANHNLMGEGTKKYIRQLRIDLNYRQSSWGKLKIERNLYVLANLLFEWLEHLKTPIFDRDNLSYIVILGSRPENCLKKLDLATQYTMEYLLRFIARLQPLSNDTTEDIIKRFVCSLTQQGIPIQGILRPTGKGYQKLREGTYRKVMEFMIKVYDILIDGMNNHMSMSPDSPDSANLKQEHSQ